MTLAAIAFVKQHPNCFERSLSVTDTLSQVNTLTTGIPGLGIPELNLPGHITASAWIVERNPISPDRQRIVLIHHRKLDRWLQPGGHADGDPDVAAVALREAQEETGLHSLRLVINQAKQPPVFDVDIHGIPAWGDVPEHLHYDIRFLLEADATDPFGFSDEVKNVQWFDRQTLMSSLDSESILRMVRKNLENYKCSS
ncbi:MAG: hydrolase [Spirosoma sp.]|nr:hydrolase [Spirosoma sp.]